MPITATPNHSLREKASAQAPAGNHDGESAFLRPAEVLEEEAEVLPPPNLWVRSEADRDGQILLWGQSPYLVEY